MKVLKTEEEYKEAFAIVEKAMIDNTPFDDELELLAVLVEDYERRHFPIKLIPGSDLDNRVYKAIIGSCEELENHSSLNGHYLAQKLATLVVKELTKRSDEP